MDKVKESEIFNAYDYCVSISLELFSRLIRMYCIRVTGGCHAGRHLIDEPGDVL